MTYEEWCAIPGVPLSEVPEIEVKRWTAGDEALEDAGSVRVSASFRFNDNDYALVSEPFPPKAPAAELVRMEHRLRERCVVTWLQLRIFGGADPKAWTDEQRASYSKSLAEWRISNPSPAARDGDEDAFTSMAFGGDL